MIKNRVIFLLKTCYRGNRRTNQNYLTSGADFVEEILEIKKFNPLERIKMKKLNLPFLALRQQVR